MLPNRAGFRANTGAEYLPPNWERAYDPNFDRYFYVDHNTKETTWLNPMDRSTKPKSPSECQGDELPYGWERIDDPICGTYYSDHIERKNQWTNPVSDYHRRQSILNQHHYSNSHHFLSIEQNSSREDTIQTPPTKPDIISPTHASSNNNNRARTNSINSNAYGTADTNNSSNQLYSNTSRSSKFDASLLDIMENCFGRESGESIEV